MGDDIWAIPLELSDFNIVVALLGGFISLFGLVSYLLKEKYYMSEARKLVPSDQSSCSSPVLNAKLTIPHSHRTSGWLGFWSTWSKLHQAQGVRRML